VRLIRITLKHKKPELLNDAAKLYGKRLKTALGSWVIGPAVPYVSRVRGFYLLDFLVKLERDAKKMRFAKDTILESITEMQRTEGFSGVRVNVDVDPF
jgi:primosomal protein N' (replication factor Y)